MEPRPRYGALGARFVQKVSKREPCPRCGALGIRFVQKVSKREYIYFAHWIREEKKVRKCYIGPVEGYQKVAAMYAIEMLHAFDIQHKLQVLKALLSEFSDKCTEEEDGEDREYCEEVRKEYEECLKRGSRRKCKHVLEELEICRKKGEEKTDLKNICNTLEEEAKKFLRNISGKTGYDMLGGGDGKASKEGL